MNLKMNKGLLIIIPSIFGAIGIIAIILILFTGANDVVDKKEIAHWKWGKYPVAGICPVKEFPIPVSPKIQEETDAVSFWNAALSRPVFVVKEGGISTQIANKTVDRFTEYCELVKLEDGARQEQSWPHIFAWTRFEGKPKAWKIQVFICLEKYHKAIKMVRTPVATRVKQLKLTGIIRHEFGHLLIGPGHPKYADLMSKNQKLTRLHSHTRALIEQTLIKPCSVK